MRNAAGVSGLILVAIALAGCGQADSLDPDPTDDAVPVYDGAELPEIAVSEIEIDSAYEADELTNVMFSGDVLLFVDNRRLSGIDTTDGALLWQREESELDDVLAEAGAGQGSLSFGAVAVGHDGSILVSYDVERCPGDYDDCTAEEHAEASSRGVAALDPTDGSLRWIQPVTSHREGIGYTQIIPIASSRDMILVSVSAWSSELEDYLPVAVALDAQDGETLWAEEGYTAIFLEGDVVGASGSIESSDETRRVGLDAATGEERWDLGDSASGRWWSVEQAGGFAVTSIDGRPELIDLENGVVLDRSGDAQGGIGLGKDSEGWLAAWMDRDGQDYRLHTLAQSAEEERRSEHLLEAASVSAISADGYIWIYEHGREVTYAIDRTGVARSDEMIGQFRAVGDGALLVQDDEGALRLWSYETQ